ncbi:MAG: radical SAM protein, partial [Planctomycetota bacterium]|nr:radical SAM protein [Planctomycetota bacterium]
MDDWPDRPQDLTRWILDQRSPKNSLDVERAYGAFVEQEPDAAGRLLNVATLLLTNRECPFRCLMCDLWKNTLDDSTPPGAIVEQIHSALEMLPTAEVVKLYNAGNFFDAGAIPREDWPGIAEMVAPFGRVIVESHPKMIDGRAKELRDLLTGRLELAIGLETVQEEVLERLNKQMT